MERRCVVCGKVIDDDDTHYDIYRVDDDLEDLWGALHAPCFYHTVDTPENALKLLKLHAEESAHD